MHSCHSQTAMYSLQYEYYKLLQGRERNNKMQLIWCLLSIVYPNTFQTSLCPSSGEQDCTTAYGVRHCNKRRKIV